MGDGLPGVIRGYPVDLVYDEVAFIAYYFHWNYNDIMSMDHAERRKWCKIISKMNAQMNEKAKELSEASG